MLLQTDSGIPRLINIKYSHIQRTSLLNQTSMRRSCGAWRYYIETNIYTFKTHLFSVGSVLSSYQSPSYCDHQQYHVPKADQYGNG